MDLILFGDFPNELIELTLSFVKYNKRRRIARAVCKTWLNCIGKVHFDIYLPLSSEVEPMAETFCRCNQLFSLTVHKADTMLGDDYNKLFCNLTNMISLDMSFVHHRYNYEAGSIRLNNLTNLQRLTLPYIGIKAKTVLPHLTYLEATNAVLADPNCIPNLEYLSITKGDVPLTTYPTVPKLKTLKYKEDILGPRINDYIPNLKVLHLPSLKLKGMVLSLQNIEELKMLDAYKLTECNKLTKLSIDGIKNFASIKAATNLQDLEIGYGSGFSDNALAFMNDMKKLNSLKIWLGEYSFTGEFLNYLNPHTLTHLTAGFGTDQLSHNITSFTNLREMKLWIEKKPDLKLLSTLTQLTSLSLLSSNQHSMQWTSNLTSLERLHLCFKSDSTTPLDLNSLTDLTQLHVQSLKTLSPMPNLTKLINLEIVVAEDYSFISKLTKLTRLHCYRSAAANHVTSLHKVRELTLSLASNMQLVALTSLQKLTYLVAARSFDGLDWVTSLTLLTRLHSLGFSDSTPVFGGHPILPWTKKDAVPQVAEKLPRLVYRPLN